MPPAASQRNARQPTLTPTTIEPSALTPVASARVCPGRAPRSFIPAVAVQRNARRSPAQGSPHVPVPDIPTTTEPSALIEFASDHWCPGKVPRSSMPDAAAHRNALVTDGDHWFPDPENPTTAEPSALVADASDHSCPASVPSSSVPPAAVQRDAARPAPWPTTVEPSALTACADCPGILVMLCPAAGKDALRTSSVQAVGQCCALYMRDSPLECSGSTADSCPVHPLPCRPIHARRTRRGGTDSEATLRFPAKRWKSEAADRRTVFGVSGLNRVPSWSAPGTGAPRAIAGKSPYGRCRDSHTS
jgi:hypothetical protein